MGGGAGAARAPGPLEPARVWRALEGVPDPELPPVSLVELGVVRDVRVEGRDASVDLTPTFSGCPALDTMKRDVESAVRAAGAERVEVRVVRSPPWTSDDITEEGRRKLAEYGVAPPSVHGGAIEVALEAPVPCPRCGSFDTERVNPFGPTACKELRRCRACREPFEGFKPL